VNSVLQRYGGTVAGGFYTKVERYGDDVLWTGYDSNGKRFYNRVPYQPTFYVARSESAVSSSDEVQYKSLLSSKPLKPFQAESMSQASKFVERYSNVSGMEICGNLNYVAAFTNEQYPGTIEFDPALIHIFSFDIEVDISKKKPDMETADSQITSIAAKSSKKDEYHVFGVKPYDPLKTVSEVDPSTIVYHLCTNERELLTKFLALWVADYPDVVTGWNCIPVDSYVWEANKISRIDQVADVLHDSKVVARSPISIKQVHRLNLGTGQKLRSSADHKFPVAIIDPKSYTALKSTKKTKLVHRDMTAAEIADVIASGNDVYVDTVLRNNTNPDNPSFRDAELYLAGLIYTDGTLCKKGTRSDGYRVFQSCEDTLRELDQLGIATAIVGPHKGCWSRGISLSHISQQAHRLIYDDRFTKKLNVPELSTLSYRQFMLFISGCLDGDGYISHNTIELCNFNGDLLGFQELCFWNGIVATISPKANSIRLRKFNYQDLSLRKTSRWGAFIPHVKDSVSRQKSADTKFKVIDENTVRTKVMSVDVLDEHVEMMDIETDTHLFVAHGVRVHNCEAFDVTYLVKRTERILGSAAVKRLSPWGIVRSRTFEMYGKPQTTYVMSGISVVDYMHAFKKFGYMYGTMQSYKLDHVANVILGQKKLSYEEYGTLTALYEQNPQLYLDYNLVDTWLIQKFEDQVGLLGLVFTVAYKSGINYNETFGTVGVWDTTIYRALMQRGIVPFVKEASGRSDSGEGLKGGYVKDPQTGLKRWVVSFDLNSLYPHLMMQYNMSPETYVRDHVENVSQDLVLSGDYKNETGKYAVAANGVCFDKSRRGIIPTIIDGYYNERAAIKQRMLAAERNLEATSSSVEKTKLNREITQLHNSQMSIKILMNGLYGATANTYFIYYIQEMASAITSSGQLSVKWAGKVVNNYLNGVMRTSDVDYVAYTDTDSVVGDSVICVNGEKITIAEYYERAKGPYLKFDQFNQDFVKRVDNGDTSLSVSITTKQVEQKPIRYIMKHKVRKQMYEIAVNGKSVIVTEDHSVIAQCKHTGQLLSIKPEHLDCKKHNIINIDTDSNIGGCVE
jgi:DNA polymerase elongation subunit (family B)